MQWQCSCNAENSIRLTKCSICSSEIPLSEIKRIAEIELVQQKENLLARRKQRQLKKFNFLYEKFVVKKWVAKSVIFFVIFLLIYVYNNPFDKDAAIEQMKNTSIDRIKQEQEDFLRSNAVIRIKDMQNKLYIRDLKFKVKSNDLVNFRVQQIINKIGETKEWISKYSM